MDNDAAREALKAHCAQWVKKALELRDVENPSAQASPSSVRDALVQARANLDQLETLLSQVIALKVSADVRAKELEGAAEDAWDIKAEAERRTMRRDYEGSKERYAYWNIAVRAERHAARDARLFADYCRGAYDRIKLAYDGLDKARQDLNSRLKHLQWESSMER